MRTNKLSRWAKSARLNKLARRIRSKHLTRRWTVRLAAVVVLMIGVSAATRRDAVDGSSASEKAAAVETKPAALKAATATPASASAPGTAAVSRPAARIDATAPGEKSAEAKATVVTITGCLARDDERFQLKDATGADAPKSRSWKTGFLTKRNATVAITGVPNDPALVGNVGQRVSVTGVLVEHEMLVQSLKRAGAGCGA